MAHILLAEDDNSMRSFLGLALERAGHTVESKSNGIEALKELETGTKPYDLLLTDIVMPGMDGIELAQKAMDCRPGIKVMFITGFAAVAMGNKEIQKNDSKILSKPFHLNELVNQVESLLEAA